MSSLDFGGSFHSRGILTQLSQKEFKGKMFPSSARKIKKFDKEMREITPNIVFYSEDVKKSIKQEEMLFTNYLSNGTKDEIKSSIIDIIKNPLLIDTPYGDVVNIKEKVKKCIEKSTGLIISDKNYIIKSSLVDVIGNKRPVRVFSLLEFEEEPKFRAISKIVLIDPFHLAIPSKYNEKNKVDAEKSAFNENKENALCMNEYYSSR